MPPEKIIWRHYFLAFVGGFLVMSAHIYLLYGRGDWFRPQRMSSTIGNALIFAHLIALMVLVARDLVLKSPALNVICRSVGGVLIGMLAWWSHLYFFLYQTSPNWLTLLFGGLGLSGGFFLSGILKVSNNWLKAIIAITITAVAIYTPIFLMHKAYTEANTVQALLYFQADNPKDVFWVGLPFAFAIAFFANLPLFFNAETRASS